MLISRVLGENAIVDESGSKCTHSARAVALTAYLANEGVPASPDTGALLRLQRDGSFATVVGELDRPTSLEFTRKTAFVVTLTGKVLRIDGVTHRAGPRS